MKLSLTTTLFFCCLFISSIAFSQTVQNQNNDGRTDIGLSVQLYPAGIIPTVNLERYLSENSSLLFRLGGNFADRQDFSDVNDNEEGSGFGGTIGYHKHYPLKKGEIIAGFNTDLWNLWIDWRDGIGTPNETSGTTYTLVLQPWLEAGYFFNLNNTKSKLGITAGFGREINVITNGEEVAQDWIASLSLQYKFQL